MAGAILAALPTLLAYGVGLLLGLPRLEHQVLVLQTATPVAVNAFLLTREFGKEATRVARSVVVSTFLSFLTIPLFLLLIGVR